MGPNQGISWMLKILDSESEGSRKTTDTFWWSKIVWTVCASGRYAKDSKKRGLEKNLGMNPTNLRHPVFCWAHNVLLIPTSHHGTMPIRWHGREDPQKGLFLPSFTLALEDFKGFFSLTRKYLFKWDFKMLHSLQILPASAFSAASRVETLPGEHVSSLADPVE